MRARVKTLFRVIIASLFLASIALNVFMALRIRTLEDRIWISKLRLVNFAIETGTLVKETKKLTLKDIKESSTLGAPWGEGNNYIIDWDPQYAFGIRYLFDKKGFIVGWEEEPKILFRFKDDQGKEMLRGPDEIIYENDGIVVHRD